MPFPPTAHTAADATSNRTPRSHNTAPHRSNAARRFRNESPYQQRTSQRDNPTQLVIKHAVDHLIQQLEAGRSEALTAYLTTMARFHSYSFGNILAIARQKRGAQRVAGIRTWNELGRFVRKGEKDIRILAPMIGYRRSRKDETAEQDTAHKPPSVLIGFRAVNVFERLSRDLRPDSTRRWNAVHLRGSP